MKICTECRFVGGYHRAHCPIGVEERRASDETWARALRESHDSGTADHREGNVSA